MMNLLPKYVRIREDIKTKILSNSLSPDGKLPTEREICKSYDVSRITAVRVLNDLRAEGLVHRIPAKGTFIKTMHQNNKIAVIVPVTGAGIYPMLISAIDKSAYEHGYEILLCNTGIDFDYAKKRITSTLDNKIAGVIFAPIESPTDKEYTKNIEIIKLFNKKNVPFVLIDKHLHKFVPDCMSVTTNNFDVSYGLTCYLIELGHKRIGYLRALLASSVEDRINGYTKALIDAKIKPVSELVVTTMRGQEIPGVISRFLNMKPSPTAIMCYDDITAQLIINELKKRKLQIPGQISVTGYDNLPLSANLVPPLTTVEQPLEQEAITAVKLLIDKIKGKTKTEKHIILKSRIIYRGSTGKVNEIPASDLRG
jgi:DNA-binding LacI/PurR family transcriptional regulator